MLDSVCEVYFKNTKNKWLSSSEKNSIREVIGDYFLTGSIYVLQSGSSQEILGAFCIRFNYFNDMSPENSESRYLLPFISFPCVKKSYQDYFEMIFYILEENILNRCPKLAGEFIFVVENNHKYAYNVVKNLLGSRMILKDGNLSYFMQFSFADKVTETEVIQIVNENKMGECLKAQSDSYKPLVEQRDRYLRKNAIL